MNQESLSRLNGDTMKSYGLPSPSQTLAPLDAQLAEQDHFFEELSLNAIEAITKFDEEEKVFFSTIVGSTFMTMAQFLKTSSLCDSSSANKGSVFWISQGHWQDTWSQCHTKLLEANERNVITVATSIATAQLFRKGRIAHLTFWNPVQAMRTEPDKYT